MESLQEQLDIVSKDNEAAHKEIDHLRKKLRNASDKVSYRDSVINHLRGQLDAYIESEIDYEDEIKENQGEISALKHEIAELRDALRHEKQYGDFPSSSGADEEILKCQSCREHFKGNSLERICPGCRNNHEADIDDMIHPEER